MGDGRQRISPRMSTQNVEFAAGQGGAINATLQQAPETRGRTVNLSIHKVLFVERLPDATIKGEFAKLT